MNTMFILCSLENACSRFQGRHWSNLNGPEDKAECQRIVASWAQRTGKTGARWSQSRQSVRRRLRKHGLNSEYARNLTA